MKTRPLFLRHDVSRKKLSVYKIMPLLLVTLACMFSGTTLHAQCSANYVYYTSYNTAYFTDSSSASHAYTSSWNFGDGSSSHDHNAHHTYASGGRYRVCHTITDTVSKCTDTHCDTIYVSGPPCYASFSMSRSKLTVSFTNNSKTVGTYTSTWDFGDGHTSHDKNPTHTYAKDSTYTICLTVTDSANKCSNTYCNQILVYGSCHASLYAIDSGYNWVHFYNNSDAEHSFTSYWTFGDGSSSHDKNPRHEYKTNGTFYVHLTITDSISNCSKTEADTVRIYYACMANMTYHIEGEKVRFSDSASHTAHAHTTLWSFGDGTYSHDEKPTHTYSSYGNFTVCVTVTDTVTKCSDTRCLDVELKSCKAYFTYTVSGHTVTLIDKSTSLHPHTRIWYFFDGNRDSVIGGDTVVHTFDSSYHYSFAYVSLQINDSSSNCWDGYESRIDFPAECDAIFNYSTDNKKVTFSTDSLNLKSSKYKWDFGDGSHSDSRNPDHTYSSYGSYTVCLTVSDSDGSVHCSSKKCQSITLTEPTYCISGHIMAGSNYARPCKVFLITYNSSDSTVKSIDTTYIGIRDTGAHYSFCGLHDGTYYVKAELDSPGTDWKHYVPTYYKDAVKWKKADAVTISGANTNDINISMHRGSNKGGPGFIAGKVTQGAGKVGDGLAGIEVMLLDADGNVVAYTFTDANGDYSFSNIPLGSYTVYVEMPGVNMIGGDVTLTENNPTQNNILIAVSQKEAHTYILEKDAALSVESANIYPNPVNDKLTLQLNAAVSQQLSISVYDVTGKLMSATQNNAAAGTLFITIDTHTLPQGLYFLKVQMGKEQRMLEGKFMKIE